MIRTPCADRDWIPVQWAQQNTLQLDGTLQEEQPSADASWCFFLSWHLYQSHRKNGKMMFHQETCISCHAFRKYSGYLVGGKLFPEWVISIHKPGEDSPQRLVAWCSSSPRYMWLKLGCTDMVLCNLDLGTSLWCASILAVQLVVVEHGGWWNTKPFFFHNNWEIRILMVDLDLIYHQI